MRRGETTPTYQVWKEMRRRCHNASRHDSKNYCLRGIGICEQWNEFAVFLVDMGERPLGMTLERLDNDKGYDPQNCAWVTRQQQANNRRDNRMVQYKGGSMTLANAIRAAGSGVAWMTVAARLRRGWSLKQAIEVKRRNPNSKRKNRLRLYNLSK